MILDCIKNIHSYTNLSKNFNTAIQFILDQKTMDLADGRYEVDGSNIYAMISTTTMSNIPDFNHYEAHQVYADIQYIKSENEIIYYLPTHELEINTPYDKEKDIAFYNGKIGTKLVMKKDDFAIFMPQDAHLPCCMVEGKEGSKKIVIKVRMEG